MKRGIRTGVGLRTVEQRTQRYRRLPSPPPPPQGLQALEIYSASFRILHHFCKGLARQLLRSWGISQRLLRHLQLSWGAYIIPLGRSAVASGTLPDHPGIDYHYDSDTGHFTLYTNDSNIDDRQTLFTGVAGADGLIRTQEGDVVGRRVDGSVIVDMDRLGSVLAAQVDDAADETGAIAIAQAQTTTEDPKLCPDPEPDVPGNKSARSVAYQEFVSSFVNPEHPIPLGFAVYYFNPETGRYVALDDCDQSNGEPVEAKGYGFARMLQNPIVQKFLGMRFLSQANRQVDASSGRPIRWYVAEPEAAAYIRTLFSRPKLSSIQVFNLPAPMLKIMVWWRNFPNTLQQSEEQLA